MSNSSTSKNQEKKVSGQPSLTAVTPSGEKLSVSNLKAPDAIVPPKDPKEEHPPTVGRTDSGHRIVEDVSGEKVAGEEGYVRVEE